MSYYKPIIVTAPSTLSEMYIKHEENGFCLPKNENFFVENLNNILKNKNKQKEVGLKARKDFEEKYSRYNMGKRIGEKLIRKHM